MIPQDCFEVVKEFMFGTYVETDTMKGWQDSNKKMHGVVTFTDEDGTRKSLFEHGKFQHDIEVTNNEGQLTFKRDTVDGHTRIRKWYPNGVYRYQKISSLKKENYSETKWYPCGSIKSMETNEFLRRWYPNGVKRIEVYYTQDGKVITCTFWDENGVQQEHFDEDAEQAEYFDE